MAEAELAELARRARAGDRHAFERIVALTARALYAHIVPLVRDRQKSEDLVQESFVAAWKNIAGLENIGANGSGLLAWLLTLARNKVRDAVKSEQRLKRGGTEKQTATGEDAPPRSRSGGKTTHGPLGEVADVRAEPAVLAERAEAQERVLRLLAELPEEYRQVLEMRYLGGADYQAIRAALGMTDGALRGVLNRGMAMLRERMSAAQDKVTRP